MSERLAPVLRDWLSDGVPTVRIVVSKTAGSTPRETGAAMLISSSSTRGTIGGGRLEQDAIDAARRMLDRGEDSANWDVPLGQALGQCCGGRVWLRADRATAMTLDELERAEQVTRPTVLLFGAGHVGRAMARALALLDLRIRWIDERRHELDWSLEGQIEIVASPTWEREIADAPLGAACIVLTHSHALDSLITAEALERGTFCYVGLIGSRTKRRRFEHAFRDIGIPEARIRSLVCPIGDRGLRDKRPEIIAALTAAELIEVFADAAKRAAPLHEETMGGMAYDHREPARRKA